MKITRTLLDGNDKREIKEEVHGCKTFEQYYQKIKSMAYVSRIDKNSFKAFGRSVKYIFSVENNNL